MYDSDVSNIAEEEGRSRLSEIEHVLRNPAGRWNVTWKMIDGDIIRITASLCSKVRGRMMWELGVGEREFKREYGTVLSSTLGGLNREKHQGRKGKSMLLDYKQKEKLENHSGKERLMSGPSPR
jgi:hypothetical protein